MEKRPRRARKVDDGRVTPACGVEARTGGHGGNGSQERSTGANEENGKEKSVFFVLSVGSVAPFLRSVASKYLRCLEAQLTVSAKA
jgi:hypothetical protein